MLKEVLVQGCMGRFASNEVRERWAGWLIRLFGPSPVTPQLLGTVVDVALGSAQDAKPESCQTDGITVRLRHLNEVDVQRLLEPLSHSEEDIEQIPPFEDPSAAPGGEDPDPSKRRTRRRPAKPQPSTVQRSSKKSTRVEVAEAQAEASAAGLAHGVISTWPPRENAFSLIGQESAAMKLYNKVELARGTGRRFTDTLFIGSAGVGKSSLARAVAKQLLVKNPVFFSGSDLPKPNDLMEKLREQGKVPRRARGRVRVGSCLVFIDEVHALGKSTRTALLSAMDDTRIATVGGVEYDFGDVIFVGATTDKGLLSDAFVSRMDIIPLAAYSLDELAGIIYFHAKKLFGGYELPRDVCIEVAARSRCNPRRAVRSLENDLLAEFYNRLSAARRRQKNAERAAASLMTTAAVAAYYDSHGVDLNGLDDLGRKTLAYLKTHGASPEDRLSRGMRITNRGDFVELIEYLTRLGLIKTGPRGRELTAEGRRYLSEPSNLRKLI
jgi:Holliday junction resolvasome RuvABC ATP-dependent DNA helicase subunit